jgi:hypothetical protein
VAGDFDGELRPSGPGFDIGFDEYQYAVAVADAYQTPPNTPLLVSAPGVLTNDSNLNGGSLTALLVSGPMTGMLDLADTGAFTFTPPLNLIGPVTFTYAAESEGLQWAPAVVIITIQPYELYLPVVVHP